jgi:hypothetical protein
MMRYSRSMQETSSVTCPATVSAALTARCPGSPSIPIPTTTVQAPTV